jgi:hypothetical protein
MQTRELERTWSAVIAVSFLFSAGGVRADAVIDWNAIMETTVLEVDPYVQTRTSAITQLAVFEAVNAIVGDYEPYLGTVTAPPGASPEAAAITAAHGALKALHPESAANLDSLRAASLAAVLDGQAKDDGMAVGEAAAAAIVALRASDDSDDEVPYAPGSRPGDWRPTPPGFDPAWRPQLGKVVTFVIDSGDQFRLDPPPTLRSARYARDYNEVKQVGDVNSTVRPQDRTDVARLYAASDTIEAYHAAARQVAAAQGTSLAENARVFALLSIATFDAAVAVFDSKYHYDYWRPVTAIRAGDRDDNRRTAPDPEWTPLIDTPPFPSYPSGHGGLGAAARRVLEDVFGAKGHSITLSNPEVPGVVRHYTSWKQITDDIDDARVFGGIHYRFDQESAARQGRRVGSYVLRHRLRPVRGRD